MAKKFVVMKFKKDGSLAILATWYLRKSIEGNRYADRKKYVAEALGNKTPKPPYTVHWIHDENPEGYIVKSEK
jgi:hypothetical protein